MTGVEIVNEIERKLRAGLEPLSIALVDECALHVGHAGAASGGGHYRVRIVADRFTGLARVARHRLVYDLLSDLMRHAVHALAIEALTPDEAALVTVASSPAPGAPH